MNKFKIIEDYLIKYPLRYCIPVFIGVLTRDDQTMLDGATATMLESHGRRLLITDDHVVAGFEKHLMNDSRVKFQAGAEVFDPRSRCIDRNAEKDLFVIDATELNINDRTEDCQLPPLEFYVVPDEVQWPPKPVGVSDTVILGGFPGAMRDADGFKVINGSYSVASIPVTGSFPNRFSCTIDRSTWRSTRASDSWARDFKQWGGLSGGPVFQDGPGLLRPTLAGFIQEYHSDYDQLHASHAGNLRADGKIVRTALF